MARWPGWQSEANLSPPANLGNAGRLRQIAGKVPSCSKKKPQHLNALDSARPSLMSRDNLLNGREARSADEVPQYKQGLYTGAPAREWASRHARSASACAC